LEREGGSDAFGHGIRQVTGPRCKILGAAERPERGKRTQNRKMACVKGGGSVGS
jgi:hypothetical protein